MRVKEVNEDEYVATDDAGRVFDRPIGLHDLAVYKDNRNSPSYMVTQRVRDAFEAILAFRRQARGGGGGGGSANLIPDNLTPARVDRSPTALPRAVDDVLGHGPLRPVLNMSSDIAYSYHFDISTSAAGDEDFDLELPFDAAIVDIEMVSDDTTAKLLQASQNGVNFVEGTGSGIPVATFQGTSLLRRRFAGRSPTKKNPVNFKIHHGGSGTKTTTVIVHLDRGPGSCAR